MATSQKKLAAESQKVSAENIGRLRTNYAFAPSGADQETVTKEAASPNDSPVEWAIIVTHGMGQQIHFETLESIALAIRNAEIRKRKQADPIDTRVAKLETFDGKHIDVVRAEMTVRAEDGTAHKVHVYESYWAPLTEGRVKLSDVLRFLGEGALNGFGYLFRHFGRFDRWAFGKMRRYRIRGWLTALKLIFALFLLFVPVVLSNFLAVTQSIYLLAMAVGTRASLIPRTPQAAQFPLGLLTPYVVVFEFCLLLFALGTVVLPKFYRSPLLEAEGSFWVAFRWITRAIALVLSFGALGLLVVVEILLVRRDSINLSFLPLDNPWMLAVVWSVAVAAALVSRWFLVQFIGDVAVYVSAHKLSRFDELRQAIQKCVFDVMGAVYSARNSSGFQYKKIIVAGHSLGSVISYDLLNQLLEEDILASSATATVGKMSRNVQERTKLLLTFGSPLDKIAYLFRIKKSTDELREAAAAAWQPLIQSYSFRPEFWLNIYSWMDLFSAPLHFYANPDVPITPKDVNNRIDWRAWVPIVAHTAYWTDPILGDSIYDTIVGRHINAS